MELTTAACMPIAPILLVAMTVPANKDMWTMEMELFVVRLYEMLCTRTKFYFNEHTYKISTL